jgi:hypothetical protein
MKFRNRGIGCVEILKNIYATWGRFPSPHKEGNQDVLVLPKKVHVPFPNNGDFHYEKPLKNAESKHNLKKYPNKGQHSLNIAWKIYIGKQSPTNASMHCGAEKCSSKHYLSFWSSEKGGESSKPLAVADL